jgi:hypothetical protein
MKPLAILAAAVRDWDGATEQPEIARALLTPSITFSDELSAFVAREMVLCAGDWRRAVKTARQCSRLPRARVDAFSAWAEQIAADAAARQGGCQ